MEASDQTQAQPDPAGTDPASAPEEGTPATDPSPATSEPSPGDTEGSPSESTEPSPEETSPSSDPAPTESSESASDEPADAGDQGGGLLAGTGSEQEPGVGGAGDHPAPAQMRDPESGELHSAGQPPSGTVEQEQSPTGDATDQTSAGHALSDEAREELEQVHEPDQAETERPDLGTE